MSSANWLLVNTLTDQKDLLLSGEWAGGKVNQISPFQPTKLKIWTVVKWDPFKENDCLSVSWNLCRSLQNYRHSWKEEGNWSLKCSKNMHLTLTWIKKSAHGRCARDAKKFSSANLHVTDPTATCYWFVSPAEWNPLENSRQWNCC